MECGKTTGILPKFCLNLGVGKSVKNFVNQVSVQCFAQNCILRYFIKYISKDIEAKFGLKADPCDAELSPNIGLCVRVRCTGLFIFRMLLSFDINIICLSGKGGSRPRTGTMPF